MVGVLGVSASAILVRFSQAPSGVTAAYRLGWTVLLLLPVVLLRCRAELRRVTARDLVLCGASGVLLALHFLTWFESLKRTSVASSTVLVSTEVIFTALASPCSCMEKSHGWGCGPFSWPLGAAPCWPSPEAAGQGSCPATCWPWLRPRPPPSIPHRTDTAGPSVYHGLHLSDLSACFLTLLLGTPRRGRP